MLTKASRGLIVFLLFSLAARAAEPVRPREVIVRSDVSFLAPERKERLDLYLPAGRAAEARGPAVVWIHGGGWTGGSKTSNREKNVCRILAEAGYVCASLDYRLGAGAWPQNLLDCKNGVRYVRAHAAELGIDPDRIAVAGGSAGGHLALMVALTTGQGGLEPAAPYENVSSAVRCVLDFYGITNLLTRQETNPDGSLAGRPKLGAAASVFGEASANADVYRLVSPITHITAGSPPVLIAHGRADITVDHGQALELAQVLQERGVVHELVLIEGVGHTFDLESWNRKSLPLDLRAIVLAFLQKHLGSASGAAKLSDAVATVNGDAITAREFVESLRRLRSRHEDIAELRRAALEACVRFKIVQQLAREHGVLADVSDAALRAAFAEENARRAAALARTEVVYGPRKLSWEQFRATWLDRLERNLARALMARDNAGQPKDANREYAIVAQAVRQAVAGATVRAAHAVIATLDASTPLDVE